jgi:hypothetical protein
MVLLYNAYHYIQTQSGAFANLFGCKKRVEDPAFNIIGDPRAIINY